MFLPLLPLLVLFFGLILLLRPPAKFPRLAQFGAPLFLAGLLATLLLLGPAQPGLHLGR